MTELLKPREVANRLGVAPVTVRRMVHRGQLQAVRVGKQLRYRPEDVEALVKGVSSKRLRTAWHVREKLRTDGAQPLPLDMLVTIPSTAFHQHRCCYGTELWSRIEKVYTPTDDGKSTVSYLASWVIEGFRETVEVTYLEAARYALASAWWRALTMYPAKTDEETIRLVHDLNLRLHRQFLNLELGRYLKGHSCPAWILKSEKV